MKSYFVCLEGIDGSGKTSTSLRVVDKLKEKGIEAIYLEKKQTDYPSQYLTDFMTRLKELLWGYNDKDPFKEISSEGWLFMHALWYTVMSDGLVKHNLEQYQVVLVDGWYYKILSRFLLKKDFNEVLLAEIFRHIPNSDVVFMLDVNPEESWKRREHYRVTEMGGYDNHISSPQQGYIAYQGLVREKLLNIANKESWEIIQVENLSLDHVARLISDELEDIIKNQKISEAI